MELLTDPPPPSPSLLARLADRRRGVASSEQADSPWWIGTLLGLLLAAGPLTTLAMAQGLAALTRNEAAATLRAASSRLAARSSDQQDRATLAPLLARPGVGATAEVIARTLPAEATLVRVDQTASGRLSIDIAAPDPDRVRAALRREPLTEHLRDVAQRGGDGTMIVTFESGR